MRSLTGKKKVFSGLIMALALGLMTAMVVAGCGGEGTGSIYDNLDGGIFGNPAGICFREIDNWIKDTPDLAIDNLEGTYTLIGFSIEYFDEFMNSQLTLTEADMTSWAGTMTVTPTFTSQTIDLEGNIVQVADNYTFTPIDATHGTMHLLTEARDLPITINGNELVTDTDVLCMSSLRAAIFPAATGDVYFGGVLGITVGQ